MQMTEIEIVGSFKRSENRKEQIEILAQLNACDKEEIEGILEKYNIDVSKYKKKKRKKKEEVAEAEVVKEEEPKEEMELPVGVIPKVVKTVCENRIARLTEEIEKHFENIKEMEMERDILCDYLGING